VIDVEELGVTKAKIEDLLGKDPAHNASLARSVLAGDAGPVRDIVVLNAAAGITSFELAKDHTQQEIPLKQRLVSNIERAQQAIDLGAASAKLAEWAEATQQ